MNAEQKPEERRVESDVEQETLWGRKFSLTEAIARLAGGGIAGPAVLRIQEITLAGQGDRTVRPRGGPRHARRDR